MKKLMTILLIAFCSCTNSGKLIGDKWPYSNGVIMTTSPAGLDGIIVTYNGSPTKPTNVGTYIITTPPKMPCVECMAAEMHLKVVIVLSIGLIALFIVAFILDKLKIIKP